MSWIFHCDTGQIVASQLSTDIGKFKYLCAKCCIRTVWPDENCTNVYKSCPKTISQEKWMILTPLQKLPNNVGDLGKMIVATGFEWLPKVQNIAQSGHTDHLLRIILHKWMSDRMNVLSEVKRYNTQFRKISSVHIGMQNLFLKTP